MAQARNDREVQALFQPLIKKAVEYVVEQIMAENRELIEKMVYEAYDPEEYERTGEFAEAWTIDTKILQNVTEGQFKYDPRLLTVDGKQHGSIIDGRPMTQYLAEVIYSGLSGDIYQSGYAKYDARFKGQAWTKARNVWAALLKWLGTEKLGKLFKEGMRRQGVSLKSHHRAIRLIKDKR